jgi:hypothetical protein
MVGCKSQQQVQQEDFAKLQAQMASAQQDEDKACFAPLRELDKSGTKSALTGTAQQSVTPAPNPLNTPACKSARDKYEQIGEQVAALQAKLAAH